MAAWAVSGVYGQSHWQIEGTLVHTPLPVGEELRGDYSPASAQTLVSLTKSPAALESVTHDLGLPVSAQALDRCLRVNKPVNADAVSLVLEWPDPEVGCAIVNRLMARHAEEAAGLRREAARARLADLRTERAARRQSTEALRVACANLPPGVSADRVRTELELAAKDTTALATELAAARERLTGTKAQLDRLSAREKALANANATDSAVGLDGDDVIAPYSQRKQLVQDALRDEESRILEIDSRYKAKELEVSKFRGLLKTGGTSQYEVDQLTLELDVLAVRRKNAERAVEQRRRELAELPLAYVQTERKDVEKTHDQLSARVSALDRGLADKRREASRLADLAAAAAEARRLDDRVAGLERLADDKVFELVPAHAATASAQPVGSNRRSLAVLTFGGVFGLCLTGLVAGSWVTGRRCPDRPATYGLPVLAEVVADDLAIEARQLAVRLRGPVHQSGGVILMAPAREDSSVAEIACQLARYLALWGDSVLILDARLDGSTHALPLPQPEAAASLAEDTVVVSLSPALESAVQESQGKAKRKDRSMSPTPDVTRLPAATVTPGLFHLLRTGAADEEPMIRETGLTGVRHLPVGTADPDPDLFASAAMHRLLLRLSERYDRILMLGPPMSLPLAAEVLSGYADGVVVVVRRCDPVDVDVGRAVEAVRGAGAPWVGAVVRS